MKKNRWFAVFTALALAFTMFGCKPEIQYVDKTYCESVTFASEATENGVKVTMATATNEAVIYYTTDGTAPTAESTKYSEAVEFTEDVTVKAIAVKKGIENSPVSVATVSIKEKTVEVAKEYCAAVTFASKATDTGVKVTMATATEGASIYYTTDGTAPTAESTKYSEAVEFTKDATVKAIAVKEGLENSPVSVATVSIKEKTIVETKTEYVDKKADETAPAKVTNLAAQAKDSRVLLTWTDAADSDIYGYEVSYSGTKPINRVVLPSLDATSMMVPPKAGGTYINGLTNGTEYTFTVKTVDTSGNKSEGVIVTGIPVAGETLKIALTASVPQENGYTGNKSNTKVTVKANITTASKVKKVVWKKGGSLIAKTLLADETAAAATETEDNAVWTFDITAQDESANGTYTVAAIDEAGREEPERITIDNFDFTPPGKVKVTSADYSSESSSIIINWTEPVDADYHHVDITFTTNDGTNNSEPSQAITVNKGSLNKTFSGIDGEKAYYTYTFVTYDELGNKGGEYRRKVYVNAVGNIPEGFVEVTGTTITGNESWTPSSSVFKSGRIITIPDMYVCDHEITQAEYEKYCKYGYSSPSSSYGDGDNYPAYYVNWYDAIIYCNLRSIDEGLTPAYKIGEETDPRKWNGIVGDSVNGYCGPSSSNSTWDELIYDKEANGYRLPTEAEWEYIAREAGTSTTTYSGSDTIDEVAWYESNSSSKTHEVKGKKANSLGIYDMSGNVYEWCYDWYGTVSSTTADTGASAGSNRVHRGGSWYYYASFCAVSDRNYDYPNYRDNDLGFRVVRSSSK